MITDEQRKQIAEFFGIKPRQEWQLASADGYHNYASTLEEAWPTKEDLERYLKRNIEQIPNSIMKDAKVIPWLIYPDFENDEHAAIDLFKKINEKIVVHLFYTPGYGFNTSKSYVFIKKFGEAICDAALKIIKIEKESSTC